MCVCVRVAVCGASVPDPGTSRPRVRRRCPGAHLGDWCRARGRTRGEESRGRHTRPETRGRSGRGRLKRHPAGAQTMPGPGAGTPLAIAGSAAGMLLRRTAYHPPVTRVGPAFVYRPRHWARAARCAPRALAAATRPSEPGEVGACCQVTPPPPASRRDAAGKRRPGGALAPSPLRTEAVRPGQGPAQMGGRRGADRATLPSLTVASSALAP